MAKYGYYKIIWSDAELRELAEEMKANARAHPMDPDSIRESIASEPGELERIGPLIRIHGEDAGEFTKKYSKFITLSAKEVRPLQICYLEYGVGSEAGMVKQLTIADNNKNPLRPQDITRIGHFFLDMEVASVPVKTPPHVALLFNHDGRLFNEQQ